MNSDTCVYFLLNGPVAKEDPKFFDYAQMVVDEWIEQWHCGWSSYTQLHEYLGMTERQYKDWVKDPSTLANILGLQ